jgi:hypothetical protein
MEKNINFERKEEEEEEKSMLMTGSELGIAFWQWKR